jgi:hypothetical protein
MPSRLSSLLVRDGLVGVKRMEKAFQRQVIYGGSLDTILLEMNLVAEDRLTQYLALASGLPPAARDDAADIEDAARALLVGELAAQFRAVPLSLDGEALRVLVCSPLEITELEDLADLLDRPLQPLITPEYRWHLAYARAYGIEAPARFTTLARQLEADAPPMPVGRAAPMMVPEPVAEVTWGPVSDGRIEEVAPEEDVTIKVEVAEPAELAEAGRSRTSTLVGVTPARGDAPAPLSRTAAPLATPPPSPVESRGAAEPAAPVVIASAVEAVTPSTGVPRPVGKRADIKRVAMSPIATAGRDSPLAYLPARELLATAEDRDTIFLTLLRAARSRSRYAGLLTVQGGAAIGRVALAEPGLDIKAIEHVLIPLDAASPFGTVVTNHQPHVGSLMSGDPSIDAMVLRLGGSMPPSALLMPIVLRDRAIALIVAHRVHSDLKVADVTELLPLASAAADALGRLIVKHKSAGYRTPAAAPSVPIPVARIETKKTMRVEDEWRAPAPVTPPSVPPPPVAAEPGIATPTAPAGREIQEILDEIERATEGDAEDAIAEAIERAGETLGALVARFPGRLRVERFAVTGRPLRAAQYGGLLELVVRLGAASSELLLDKLSSAQRDTRFFATVCTAELRPRNAVYALVERVFDQDFGIRALTLEALAGYPLVELGPALARARRAVHSDDPEVVMAATTALVELGDVAAVGDLIGAVNRPGRGGEHVRRALVVLTAQDFSTSERKWRKWYEGARRRHRIEWLIEGLSHKDEAIRERAINDLRRLTGEYFGYHHDLPRREREVAAERWSSWWHESGERRFVFRENERHRPTAVLPARKD